MDNFEKEMKDMSKPEIAGLSHQEILAEAIAKAESKSVLSLWWLIIPLYIIAAFIMKNMYVPHTSIIPSLHQFDAKGSWLPVILFVIVPLLIITLNVSGIRRVYLEAGKPRTGGLLKVVWPNFLAIAVSIVLIVIYSL